MREGVMEQLLLVASNLSFIISGFFLYNANVVGVLSGVLVGGYLQYYLFKEEKEVEK